AAQRDAITSPAAGLMIWCTDCGATGEFQVNNGTEWADLSGQFMNNNHELQGSEIDGESGGDNSGCSVSLSSDGNTVAIGAAYNDGNGAYAGQVRIYENISGTWTQVGSDIDGEATYDQSGQSVSLSSDGSTVAIGARYNDGTGSAAGHVRVYKYTSSTSTWTKLGSDIEGEATYDQSGSSVSLSSDGSIVAIGAPYNDGNGSNAGHVRVYKYTSSTSTWTKLGSDIDGEATNDNSGWSVSLSSDGSTVAIGATLNGSYAGHVRVYEYISSTSTWTKLGSDIDGEAAGDNSGYSVSLSSDGSTVAIGARNNNVVGHVRVYKYISSTSTWTQVGSDIDGQYGDDQFGFSVSLSSNGSIVAIGVPYNDGKNGRFSNVGQVEIYQNISGTWTRISSINGKITNDQFGFSVSLSSDGSTVAIGANYSDGSGPNCGSVGVYLK
ncbi:MAG: hypothetical protein ACI95K_000610, partial [Lentimonas sp.]